MWNSICCNRSWLAAEYKDKQYSNIFDWLDVTATVIGGILG
nr:MAG TPA: putative periplasmic lipoprotein [Caudoviricetes sp.]